MREPVLKPSWSRPIERFINHEIWCSKHPYAKLSQQLERRLVEMKERRKNLRSDDYKIKEEQQKQIIIRGFSVCQLEEMLRSSTKSSSCAIVSCLVPSSGSGILTNLMVWIGKYKRSMLSSEQFSMQEDGQQIEDD